MAARKPLISVKRVYEPASPSDGVRVLVDRLWPRGLKKKEARIDAWLRDLAPSNELRKWFHRHPTEQPEFRKRYLGELQGAVARESLSGLEKLVTDEGKVTLLFASKNVAYNNATVLEEVVEKPSLRSSSGKERGPRTRPPKARRPTRKNGISAASA